MVVKLAILRKGKPCDVLDKEDLGLEVLLGDGNNGGIKNRDLQALSKVTKSRLHNGKFRKYESIFQSCPKYTSPLINFFKCNSGMIEDEILEWYVNPVHLVNVEIARARIHGLDIMPFIEYRLPLLITLEYSLINGDADKPDYILNQAYIDSRDEALNFVD